MEDGLRGQGEEGRKRVGVGMEVGVTKGRGGVEKRREELRRENKRGGRKKAKALGEK